MSVAQSSSLRDAEQFARGLFQENPQLGIDDAARQVSQRFDRGLVKPTLSSIRREVRQRLEAEALFDRGAKQRLGVTPTYTIRKKQVFNPPRVTINPVPIHDVRAALEAQAGRADNHVQESAMQAAAKLELPQKPKPASAAVRATKIDRQKALETWVLENPQATIEGARQMLREKFNGVAMGTKAINDMIKMSRKLWEEQRRKALEAGTSVAVPSLKPVDEPAPEPEAGLTDVRKLIASAVQMMKARGIKLIEILPEGKIRVEFES